DHVLFTLPPDLPAEALDRQCALEQAVTDSPAISHRSGIIVRTKGGCHGLWVEEIQIYELHPSRRNVECPGNRVRRGQNVVKLCERIYRLRLALIEWKRKRPIGPLLKVIFKP